MNVPLKSFKQSFVGIVLGILASFALLLSVFPIPASAQTGPTKPPAVPRNLVATTSETSVTLSWDDSEDSSITGYRIVRRIVERGQKFEVIAEDTGSAQTSYVDQDVTLNTKYVYRIKAINSVGTSGLSKSVKVNYMIQELIPQNLVAKADHYLVRLMWDRPSYSGIVGYQVLRRRANGSGQFDVIAEDPYDSSHTSYWDRQVTPDTSYIYRVRAIIPDGLGGPSNSAKIHTLRLLGMDEEFNPPMHMTTVTWTGGGRRHSSIEYEFTIHNDIIVEELPSQTGLYFMITTGKIAETDYYFGLQIDRNDVAGVGHGKRLIFSRWDTRDLGNVRLADENSWAQSSGHEGDFVGARVAYEWGAGDYKLKFAAQGNEDEGRWYGIWITDKSAGETTYAGSLRFPHGDGRATIDASGIASVLEIYGLGSVAPKDIPEWHISMKKPVYKGGYYGTSPVYAYIEYQGRVPVPNSNVIWDSENREMHMYVGGNTRRTAGEWSIYFRD